MHRPPRRRPRSAAARPRSPDVSRREVLLEFGLDRLPKVGERALVSGGQGTGKSRTAAEAIASLEGNVVIWWLVPTLEKAEEQAVEYREFATKVSMTARVVRGRGAPDPRIPGRGHVPTARGGHQGRPDGRQRPGGDLRRRLLSALLMRLSAPGYDLPGGSGRAVPHGA